MMFYIAEEAVNNARKYAEAELVSVTVSRKDDVIILQISDNGVGFDTSAVDANYDKRGSLGMVNMRERAEVINGTIRIESAEGKGTTITIVVQIKEEKMVRAAKEQSRSRAPSTNLAAVTLGTIDDTKYDTKPRR
jgi:nitrate/nitrite-specific signal transduction histidine kinase